MAREPQEILVVDDDVAMRRLLRHHLERGGYLVRDSGNGAHALQAIARSRPALVLLDYMMPGLDGPEVVRRIRELGVDAPPVILVTASNDSQHVVAAFEAGADDYITKPVDPIILNARVRSTIGARADRDRAVGADHLVAELLDARRMHANQLPALPARARGWRLTGAVSPCALVGGDTYSFVHGSAGATASLVDVAGHGAAAALLASAISGSLGALLLTRPAAEAMAALNLLLLGGRSPSSARVGAVTVTEAEVCITNAGLPPIVVIVDGEVVARVAASGSPPGRIGPCEYQSARFAAVPGQRIVLMSDGLTEPFGAADDVETALDLMGIFDGTLPSQSADIEERIAALLSSRGQADDATLLALRREP